MRAPRLAVAALAVALGLAPFASSAPARANAPPGPPPGQAVAPTGELMVLLATQSDAGGHIDPRVNRLPLDRAPFNAFNTYKLLGTEDHQLQKNAPARYALPNGSALQLTLLEVASDGRYRLAAGLDDKTKIEVTASPDDPFFLAGQPYGGGILVLGITVRK